MTQEEKDAKLAEIQARFDAATATKTQLESQLEEANIELYRLQGEYRIVNGLGIDNSNNDPLKIIAEVNESEAPQKTISKEKGKGK